MYKHVVVTGGAGFIGSNLVHEVARRFPGADLTVVDDFRSGYFKNLEGFKGDVIAGDLWLFPAGVPHSIQGLGPDGARFLLRQRLRRLQKFLYLFFFSRFCFQLRP